MKIAVISSTVFPAPATGYAGLEQVAYHCAAGLAQKGHQVTLFAPEGSECPGGEVHITGKPGQMDEHTAFNSYWPRLGEFGCIIDHSWQKWAYTLKTEGVLKCPVLGVMHAPVKTMYNTLPPSVEKPCFVCISKDQGAQFEAIHEKEARVCYNGIDLDFYQPMAVPRSNRYLFLARFSSIKGAALGQDICLAAGASLDLVGDTSITNEPEYFRLCQSKADGQQIRIIGGVPRGNSVWWMSQARAFLHPNRDFREPFGLAPVEAQACGCPVLAWDRGAMRETVLPGVTGFLVRTEQEAVDILRENKLDGLDRRACREWSSKFSLQNMIDKYDQLCQEAVEGGGW